MAPGGYAMADHRDDDGMPGPEEIVRRRDAIRDAWSPEQEYRRAHGLGAYSRRQHTQFLKLLMGRTTVDIPQCRGPTLDHRMPPQGSRADEDG
jgi:hypothetical protein